MSFLQATEVTTAIHKIIYKAFHEVKRSDFILCNTIQELESKTISALQEKQPTYAISPVFPNGLTKSTVATSLWSESDCIEWLNTKPHGSILYVSFDSFAHASKRDIEEIANGLLLSKVGFVWVLRPDVVQFTNRKLIKEEEEEKVKRVMTGKSSEELRRNAKEVKKTLEGALDEDGLSNRNLICSIHGRCEG